MFTNLSIVSRHPDKACGRTAAISKIETRCPTFHLFMPSRSHLWRCCSHPVLPILSFRSNRFYRKRSDVSEVGQREVGLWRVLANTDEQSRRHPEHLYPNQSHSHAIQLGLLASQPLLAKPLRNDILRKGLLRILRLTRKDTTGRNQHKHLTVMLLPTHFAAKYDIC